MTDSANNVEREDFRMRFGLYIDDIKYLKSRQWAVTYYLLVLVAAIIGVMPTLKTALNSGDLTKTHPGVVLALLIFGIGVGIVGTYFQYDFQKSLTKYRRFLKSQVVPRLSESFRKDEAENMGEGYDSFWYGVQFPLIFVAILWSAVSFVWLFLYRCDLGNWLFPLGVGVGVTLFFLFHCFLKSEKKKGGK